jgi:O-antigen/teichoic acid export membrane protein
MAMNQLKAGVVLSYVVIGLNTLVGLLYTPYMLRMLGQSEYGLYSLVASVISYLTILDLGFGNAIVRYTAKYRAEGKIEQQYSMFGMFVILYSLIGAIALCIGLGITFNVELLFGENMTSDELSIARTMMFLLSFNLAITFPFSLFGSIITAYENFVFQRIVQIVRIILSTITMIVLLRIGYKAIALVMVTTVFNILSLFTNYAYCRYKLKIKIFFERINWHFIKEASVFSFFILVDVIMDRVYWNSGQFILGIVSGTAAVAIFSVAITIQHMYMNFSIAISGVFLPKVTAMVVRNQTNQSISDLFIRIGRLQYIVMSFILTGFVLFGKPFIAIWAGEDYSAAYMITLLFLIFFTIPSIQNLGLTILKARNEMKFRAIICILGAIVGLGVSIPLAIKYDAIGCAIGISVALFIEQNVVMSIYYHKKQGINIPLFWKEIFKMSIVPLFVIGIVFFVLQYITLDTIPRLGFFILLFSVIYIILFWKMSMNKYEKELCLTMLNHILIKRK